MAVIVPIIMIKRINIPAKSNPSVSFDVMAQSGNGVGVGGNGVGVSSGSSDKVGDRAGCSASGVAEEITFVARAFSGVMVSVAACDLTAGEKTAAEEMISVIIKRTKSLLAFMMR